MIIHLDFYLSEHFLQFLSIQRCQQLFPIFVNTILMELKETGNLQEVSGADTGFQKGGGGVRVTVKY